MVRLFTEVLRNHPMRRFVQSREEHRTDWVGPFCMLMHFKAPHRNWIPAERHAVEALDDCVLLLTVSL